ncbi:HlyD family type I secretion periplasmic adaptor subunit [Bradyrhizobium sp. Tv2a-2]|uniref:HlyD family type I secretion periplasmic adaptor subunit n=1 Tax=Bradyrhizobium sp. Tv2a-2 TaxID=113395 RepID=UPI0004651AC2|nr:HlyD family type I secretion periplasmic adaptor subunit [Bradyrhizobium sp. Tv2a-2]
MKSAENMVVYPGARERKERDELAFLPAALEIIETPPSPIGRAIALLIMLFFCLALAWASLGTVDIVASAPGKIIPSGRTKVVQPFETGVVRAIHVRDGQLVQAGDALIELDPTMTEAERAHLRSDLIAEKLNIARLHAAAADGADPLSDFNPPPDAGPDIISTQRQLLIDQTAEHRAKLAALEDQKRQKESECASIAATIEKIEAVLPVVQERTEIRKVLFDHQTGSKVNYLEALQVLIENRKELEVQKSRLREADAALAAAAQARAQAEGEFRRGLFSDLAEAERKAAGLAHDLDKASERTRLQLLTAPVGGVVQQLAVHTIGGVVTPAQTLLVLVPFESHLEVEAMVSNRDIGFVSAGQDAEIKVDTFNFTRYGLLHGRVLNVSTDAITRDRREEATRDGSPATEKSTSEPKGQELVYAARVALDRTQMQIEGKSVPLGPGMAVTVEIRTGTRRIISYLLSPLLKYQQESLRER